MENLQDKKLEDATLREHFALTIYAAMHVNAPDKPIHVTDMCEAAIFRADKLLEELEK